MILPTEKWYAEHAERMKDPAFAASIRILEAQRKDKENATLQQAKPGLTPEAWRKMAEVSPGVFRGQCVRMAKAGYFNGGVPLAENQLRWLMGLKDSETFVYAFGHDRYVIVNARAKRIRDYVIGLRLALGDFFATSTEVAQCGHKTRLSYTWVCFKSLWAALNGRLA